MIQTIIIIDGRKEQSLKNKRILQNLGLEAECTPDFGCAQNILYEKEPDLVIISDSIKENLSEVIRKIRGYNPNLRPVIVILSKSAHMQDRIDVLNSGADDFISEPISQGEFCARISAHLRRHAETETDSATGLYNQRISFKYLKRTISSNKIWAAMLIGINNFNYYKEIYGELAADKMKQTFGAIAKSSIGDDFIGITADGEFLVITTPHKAETVAIGLVNGFNSAAKKFYSENDSKNGYITRFGDDTPGNKIALVSVSIGIISNEYKKISGLKQALHELINTKSIAEQNSGSSYVYLRPQITAENSVQIKDYNARLFVYEPDEALSYLLETYAKMRGIEVKIIKSREEIYEEEYIPAVIVIDAGDSEDLKGIEICQNLKKDAKFKNSNIIMTTAIHDKELVLNSGADLYIPKPYEITYIFEWIERLMNKFNEGVNKWK